jgi:hypothetical protein
VPEDQRPSTRTRFRDHQDLFRTVLGTTRPAGLPAEAGPRYPPARLGRSLWTGGARNVRTGPVDDGPRTPGHPRTVQSATAPQGAPGCRRAGKGRKPGRYPPCPPLLLPLLLYL